MKYNFWPFRKTSVPVKKHTPSPQSQAFSAWIRDLDVRTAPQEYATDAYMQAYQRNAIVYRCVNLIAQNLSAIPLELYRNDVRLSQHPLLDVLARPNRFQDFVTFAQYFIKHLMITGNAYIEATATGPQGTHPELHVLRPEWVRQEFNVRGHLTAYSYQVPGQPARRIPVHPETGACALLHLKLPDPANDHLGESPLKAAMPLIKLQIVIAEHNVALIENSAAPSGILMVKDQLTDDQFAQLHQRLKTLQKRGYGLPIVVDANVEYQNTAQSVREMDFSEGRNWTGREITQVLGIPPSCVGLLGDATYANYEHAHRQLWNTSLLPKFNLIVKSLTGFFQWLSGDPLLELRYNKDIIDALIDHRHKLSENVLTYNELRERAGYPPLKGGDILFGTAQTQALRPEKEAKITQHTWNLDALTPEPDALPLTETPL